VSGAGEIAVLDYGIGNLASAHKALLHLGAPARLVQHAHEADGAAGVVLPGVGAFGACAAALERSGLDVAARRAAERGTPLLGICVGFQLLYEDSEESPGASGLGVLAGTVRRLPATVKLPQMQWNRLARVPSRRAGMLEGLPEEAWVYFLHSYAPERSEDTVATCEYGETLCAAAERDHVWGTQFHPEKSSTTGLALLANFVERCTARLGESAI
jgi:glutamine amidotransferase